MSVADPSVLSRIRKRLRSRRIPSIHPHPGPTHRSDDGLPIGVQLVAHQYREDVLLRVAAQVEEAFPWDPLPCMSQ